MRWISIEERYPEYNVTILVCDMYGGIVTLGRLLEVGYGSSFEDEDEFTFMFLEDVQPDCAVTHWMYLPDPAVIKD